LYTIQSINPEVSAEVRSEFTSINGGAADLLFNGYGIRAADVIYYLVDAAEKINSDIEAGAVQCPGGASILKNTSYVLSMIRRNRAEGPGGSIFYSAGQERQTNIIYRQLKWNGTHLVVSIGRDKSQKEKETRERKRKERKRRPRGAVAAAAAVFIVFSFSYFCPLSNSISFDTLFLYI
jgi:hypothetical protein